MRISEFTLNLRTTSTTYNNFIVTNPATQTLPQDFTNEALRQRRFLWSLESTPELPKFLFAVKDELRRKLVEEVLEAWQKSVKPRLPTLERGQSVMT